MPPALKQLIPIRLPAEWAGFWLALDVVGAILFAAGLALTIAAIAAHSSVLVGGALLVLAGLWRAGMSVLASEAGAGAARSAKTMLRERVSVAEFWARPSGARSKGERIGAIVEDVEALDGWFVRFRPASQAARIAPLIALAAVFAASPVSGIILIGAFAPFIALMALVGMTTAQAAAAQFEALARLSGLFVDRVRALPLVLAYGAAGQQTQVIADAATDVRRRTLSVLRVGFMSSATLEFFAALSVALAAVYIGFNLLGLLPFHVPEHLDLFRGAFVLALAPEIYAPLRRLAGAYHDKQAGEAAGLRIAETLLTPQIARPSPMHIAAPPKIRLSGVVVHYNDGATIGPLSFVAPAGAITALLGPSGSGKTTLLSTLLGLTPLAAGNAWADDVALSDVGSFAAIGAYAGQRSVIMPRSIEENICIGNARLGNDEIARLADQVGLTPALGRRDPDIALNERGSGLSGGERRRIGIARALAKCAPLLLLDEPTADLDRASEDAIIALLRGLGGTRTVLVATHSERLAAAADHVVRLS